MFALLPSPDRCAPFDALVEQAARLLRDDAPPPAEAMLILAFLQHQYAEQPLSAAEIDRLLDGPHRQRRAMRSLLEDLRLKHPPQSRPAAERPVLAAE
ncbi:hypothetical protein GALL_308720 [mine drainage metagenome]|uniref:Uncharacterized protein n=1 Tax=mine drainage metagenome TaxID=410659 RepID=A0A1J5QUV0_9ZZZZ